MEIESKVLIIIRDVLSEDAITLESVPSEIEEWDSLANINIIISLKQEFGKDIDPADFQNINKVKDIVSLVI